LDLVTQRARRVCYLAQQTAAAIKIHTEIKTREAKKNPKKRKKHKKSKKKEGKEAQKQKNIKKHQVRKF
jgi:hypothetical protein